MVFNLPQAGIAAGQQALSQTQQPKKKFGSRFVDALFGRTPEGGFRGSAGEVGANVLRAFLGVGSAESAAENRESLQDRKRLRDAVTSGDVDAIAAVDPQQAASVDEFRAAQDERRRGAKLRAVNAARQIAGEDGDFAGALQRLTSNTPNLFGAEEIEVARQPRGGAALVSLIRGEQPDQSNRDRFISTSSGIFDAQEGRIVPGTERQERQDSLLEDRRALLRAQTDAARNRATGPSAGGGSVVQKEIDRTVGRDLAEWISGGRVVAASNLARLDDAVDQLRTTDGLTGPLAGIGDVQTRQFTNPKSAALQQQVQNAIQASLKEILGAQFARIEGEHLLDRAFAARLSQGENIRRIQIVADAVREAGAAKDALAQHVDQFGTAAGFDGPSVNELASGLERVLQQFDQDAGEESTDSGDLELLLEKHR